MTVKTLNDCAACKMVSKCDAHVSNGEWKHRKSTLIDAETANAALRIRTMGRQFERVNGTTAEEFLSERGL